MYCIGSLGGIRCGLRGPGSTPGEHCSCLWITVKGSRPSQGFTSLPRSSQACHLSNRPLSVSVMVLSCNSVNVNVCLWILTHALACCSTLRISVLMHGHAALSRRTDRGSPGQLADGELHIQTTVSRSILRTARRSANTNTRIAIARRRRGTKVGSAEANCVRRASSWPTAVQHSAICEHWSFCQRGRAAPEDTKPP